MKTRNLVWSIIGIFGLLLLTVGITYAAFIFTGPGVRENVITSGSIMMSYTEGNELHITNAMPISDEVGKNLSGDGNVFSFTVQAKLMGDVSIGYEVTATKDINNTLKDDEIKIYLEKDGEEVLSPTNYIPLEESTEIGSKTGSMIIDTGVFTETKENRYTMKMWVDENTEITEEVKNYTIRVDVHAKEGIVSKVKDSIFQLASGSKHNYVLMNSGKVYAWGSNANGQLGVGDGTTENKLIPVEMISLNNMNVKSISAGITTSAVLDRNGNVYIISSKGIALVDLPEGVKIKEICYGISLLMLSTEGEVYGMGVNSDGQLGNGTTSNQNTPVKMLLPTGVKIKEIAIDRSHSLVLSEDGEVYASGNNNAGQLGDGTNEKKSTPVKMLLPEGVKIKKIAVGSSHSLVLAENGEVYATGYNKMGQLGDGTTVNKNIPAKMLLREDIKIRDIQARRVLSVLVSETDDAYATGIITEFASTISFISYGNTPISILDGVKVKNASVGEHHILISSKTNELYTVGLNNDGQLGIGTTENSKDFIKIDFPFLENNEK